MGRLSRGASFAGIGKLGRVNSYSGGEKPPAQSQLVRSFLHTVLTELTMPL